MQAIDIIKKEFKSKQYKITSNNPRKIKFEIPGGLDFTKTSQEIFTAILLIKPQFETEITVVIEQLNSTEMSIK